MASYTPARTVHASDYSRNLYLGRALVECGLDS
jgi:hypothetical protein